MQSAQLFRGIRILTSGPQDGAPPHGPQNTTYGSRAYHMPSESVLPGVRRHLRGRRGGLKDMPEMPLDILFEVCSAPSEPHGTVSYTVSGRSLRSFTLETSSIFPGQRGHSERSS